MSLIEFLYALSYFPILSASIMIEISMLELSTLVCLEIQSYAYPSFIHLARPRVLIDFDARKRHEVAIKDYRRL